MLINERLFPLQRAYEIATGTRPHPSTCHRHRVNGINNVRLETLKYGGKRVTSVEAVRRFLAAVTAAADGPHLGPRTNRQLEAAVSRAERELDEAGM
jgi:hypothetical protein